MNTNPEEQKTTITETPAGGGGNKNRNIILIVVGAIIVLGIVGTLLGGGSGWGDKAGERMGKKLAEKILEQQYGGDVDIDSDGESISIKTDKGTFSAGEKTSWPSDMPSDVPKLTSGTIIMAGSTIDTPAGSGWQVAASNVSASDVAEYQEALRAKGWVSAADSGMAFIQMTKGNLMITLVSDEAKEEIVLIVSPK